MSPRVLTFGLICLGGLLAAGQGLAQEQGKRRATRHAIVGRVVDDAGDRHEKLLHEVALGRTSDHSGDAEVARLFRAGHKGEAVLHANLDRGDDPRGDLRVQAVAMGRNARRAADLRRTRDLRGDVPVITAWKNFRIRHGNLSNEVYRIAQEWENQRLQDYREERDPRSGNKHLETDEDNLRREERSADRSEERELANDERREDRRGGGIHDEDFVPDDELEREEDRLEEEAEQQLEREEEAQDRDIDREEEADEAQEDRDIERQINNEEGDLEEENLDE